MNVDRDELARLTEQYGGAWGINHTRRLLHLVERIAAGRGYDAGVVWTAAHLHDWGAYVPWAQEGVDHALRSVQVAATFLSERGCPAAWSEQVLACIRSHHACDAQHSLEAILLYDADALDFLGVVGVLRDFSKNSRNLRKGYEVSRGRREKLPGTLILDSSRRLAEKRVADMDTLFLALAEDSFGCF